MVKVFKIVLNQPPSGPAYSPGSEVSGTVVVEVDEPKNYNSITVSFTGKSHVFIPKKNGTRQNPGYTAGETWVSLERGLWWKDKSADGMLPPGEHHYQFRFLLPLRCPSSFEAAGPGWIRYIIEAKIDREFPKPNCRIEAWLQVVKPVFISADSLRLPFRLEKSKTTGRKSAPQMITTTVEVPRTGYCVGEEIPLRVTVENGSNKSVRVTAVLQEKIIYTAQGHHRYGGGSHISRRSNLMEPRSTTVWGPQVQGVKIPVTAPTTVNIGIIRRLYYLEFTIHIPYVCCNPTLSIPLTIGNVPYSPDGATGGATAPPGPPLPFLPPLPPANPELTSFDSPSYQDAVTK